MAALFLEKKDPEKLDNIKVSEFVNAIFGETMHQKRIKSLANAAIGLLYAEELILHKIGEGLAQAKGLNKKHATKQVDRLLSNQKLNIWDESGIWAPHIIGDRKEIMVSMDWTDFHADGQSTIAINLLTNHGRAIPILWKTVKKSTLKNNRTCYEDQILSRLKNIVPEGVKVTVLADRGFAHQKFLKFIDEELGFFYIIRTKSNIYVTDKNGITKSAKDWLKQDGVTKILDKASMTEDKYPVEKFVFTKQKGMKNAWYLMSNCTDLKGLQIVKFYEKRWTIEPYFRDMSNQRCGMGLSSTHISTPERRDRLFFISAIALLIILGLPVKALDWTENYEIF